MTSYAKKIISQVIQYHRLQKLRIHGDNVIVNKGCVLQGDIEVGSHVSIGRGAQFVSTQATIHIHDYVVFGPNVTIYTGDHPIHVIGKHICEITDSYKEKMKIERGDNPWDQDVVIESGCWIGTRAIILKGVTIGKGSVIGAGAVVTKDVPPYSIYVGTPPARISSRFSEEEILEHERILKERGR